MSQSIKPGLYQHSKSGRQYQVHFVAKHSETLEDMVVYEAQYKSDLSQFWVRPAKMFTEEVVIGGVKKPRFIFLSKNLSR